MNGTDYTLIVVGTTGAFLFFAAQLILFYKAKTTAVKLIPVYVILFFALLAVTNLLGLLGKGFGVISLQGIAALAIAVIIGIASVGEIAALAVYRIRKRKNKKI